MRYLDTLEENLLWFEQEFQVLFEEKCKSFSNSDKKVASRIIDKLNREFRSAPDEETRECVGRTLTKLKLKYPELIKD